jgi:hypothetical protein
MALKSMVHATYKREVFNDDGDKTVGLLRLGCIYITAALACCLVVTQAYAQKAPSVKQAGGAKPATRSPSNEEVAKCIKELTEDSFVIRQAAASSLLSAGMAARDQLQTLADGPEPEARASARRLIALIDQAEFHRRLEAFAADTDGKQGATLPGWDEFQKLVGDDSGARALYADMYRQEGPLIAAAFGDTRRSPNELLESRLARLNQLQPNVGEPVRGASLASCATMLFLGSLSEVDVSYGTAMMIESLLGRPPIIEALRSGEKPQLPIRRLVVAWVLHCPTKSEDVLNRRLEVITVFGLKEALPLPSAVAAGEPPYHRALPMTRGVAALIVGQLGGPDDVEKLEPLLNDATVCFGPQMPVQGHPAGAVQMRDAALVALLQLTNQRPADYGYIGAQLQPLKLYQLRTLFQLDEQRRAEAIGKWRQWRGEARARQKRTAANSPKAS